MATIPTCTLVTYNPAVVSAEERLVDAISVLADSDMGEIPVVEAGRRYRGLLTVDSIARLFERDGRPGAGLRVSDVPLTDGIMFSAYDAPWPPLAHLLRSGLRLAAVGEGEQLDGVITRIEFLQELATQSHPAALAPVIEHVQPVAEPIEATTAVDEVLRMVLPGSKTVVPIGQGGLPLGAVHRDDLARRQGMARAERQMGLAPRTKVSLIHALTSCPHLQPGQSMADAARMMMNSGARALLVVNKGGRIQGAITEDQLLERMLDIRHAI